MFSSTQNDSIVNGASKPNYEQALSKDEDQPEQIIPGNNSMLC